MKKALTSVLSYLSLADLLPSTIVEVKNTAAKPGKVRAGI